MTSRSWEALVVEGKCLGQVDPLDRWAIGDLAIEAIPPGESRAERSAVQERLKEFSAATGISLGVLKDCHRTSEAWPPDRRIPGESHAKHSRYAARPNRVSLLLNDDISDGLSIRQRERVKRAEELLADKVVRTAVMERSRSRRIRAAARTIDEEELSKARRNLRARQQDERTLLVADEIGSKAAERAIKGSTALARMVAELLDLRSVIDDVPEQYHDRIAGDLSQISRAAQQVFDILRPEQQSPQPRTIIITNDDQPGTEHW
jgi:hypothetical protein